MGVPAEFKSRETPEKCPVTRMLGFGVHSMPAGIWSDDAGMALCALGSLSHGGYEPDSVMNNFCRWYYENQFTATGEVFDVGGACAAAIRRYRQGTSAEDCGLKGERNNGNGSLMRIYPFTLYLTNRCKFLSFYLK